MLSQPSYTIQEVRNRDIDFKMASARVRSMVAPEVANQYDENLAFHIRAVQVAGEFLGVSSVRLKVHDASKFTEAEYAPYARWFFTKSQFPNDDIAVLFPSLRVEFQKAWIHHVHANSHHWSHWVLPLANRKVEALQMPEDDILEMVADWMGASLAYEGQWGMTRWLTSNYKGVVLHKASRKTLNGILKDLGYNVEYFLSSH